MVPNLKDDWLIRLNKLHLFDATNVCEGHYSCDDAYPHIVLIAKRDYFDGLKNLFGDREWLLSIFNEIFASDTEFSFSHTLGVSNDPNSIMNNTAFTPIKLSIYRKYARESLDFDDKTSEWFEASVSFIERIDEVFRQYRNEFPFRQYNW